jgi:hypothetical protein
LIFDDEVLAGRCIDANGLHLPLAQPHPAGKRSWSPPWGRWPLSQINGCKARGSTPHALRLSEA